MKTRGWQAAIVCAAGIVVGGCSQAPQSQPAAQGDGPEEPAVMAMASDAAADDAEMAVEVGCAMCMYKVDGVDTCRTAAKIGEEVYLVSGGDVDAHSAGLCSTTKQATVMGHIADGKLVASSIILQ